MDVANVAIGAEGALNLKLEGGKIVLTITHVHASGEVVISAKEDAKYFLEKLKGVIPGTIDDMLINVAEASLP